MANSSSEDKTVTLPKRPTRIQPYQFEPVRQDFERVHTIPNVIGQQSATIQTLKTKVTTSETSLRDR